MKESKEPVASQDISRLVEEIKSDIEKILKRELFVKVYSEGTTVPFWRIAADEEMYDKICAIYCETKKREISFWCNFENWGKEICQAIQAKLQESAPKLKVHLKNPR